MALTNWNDILNKPNGINQIEEIALDVSHLSSSVLEIKTENGHVGTNEQAENITISRNSFVEKNGIVTFEFTFTLLSTKNIAFNSTILSGLPLPKLNVDFVMFELGSSGEVFPCNIDTSGNLKNRKQFTGDSVSNTVYGGSGSYVISTSQARLEEPTKTKKKTTKKK